MSETKKVQLTTVTNDKGKVKCKIGCKTIRFILSLTESNEKSCSEFNYGELLTEHFHKKFVKNIDVKEVLNGPELHPNDPLNKQDDTDLKEMARKFEHKYGTSITGKKKKKKTSDFQSLGQGYDESDPFIDNSDALDDAVPKNVDTKYGGFYINSGELDFHKVELSDEDSEGVKVRCKKRKIIDSSDDSESSKVTNLNGYVNNKFDEGEIHRRRKKMIHKFNAKKHNLPHSPTERDECNKVKLPGLSVETSIAASIDAVLSKVRDSSTLENGKNDQAEEGMDVDESETIREATTTASSSSSSSSSESSSSESESENEDNRGEIIKRVDSQLNSIPFSERCSSPEDDEAVPLPNNLPLELTSVLDKIKEVGRNSRGSSQKFFTDPAVNKMLLSIEIKLNKFEGGRKKTQVYRHLAGHLPCGMQTIVKRGKNLLTERLEGRLKDPINRLQAVITKIMPTLLELYTLECQKLAQKKNEKVTEVTEDEKNSKNTLPKKKFKFTEDAICKLCEVVKVRCQGWHMIKKRNEDPEEHVKSFLEEYVKPIWPKGWMSTKLLYKLTLTTHSYVTSKKPVISQPAEDKLITNVAQPTQPSEKSVLSYEPVELPYHLEKMVNETTILNVERLISAESKLTTKIDVTVNKAIQNELKMVSDHTTYTMKKPSPDPVSIAIKEQLSKPHIENSSKLLKTEEPVNKVDQSVVTSGIEPSKISNDVTKCSSISLAKVPFTYNNSEPLKECRAPKPSLSATAIPKLNIIPKGSELITKEKTFNMKDGQRNTITCITIKSIDKINEINRSNHKDIKKPTEVVQSVSIMDLSIGKNKKIEPTTKLNDSIALDADKRPENVNDQVVDLCLKSSPVKNAKLDQEMDKVMSDLIQISRNLQGTPEPSPETPTAQDLSAAVLRYADGIKIEKIPKSSITKSNSDSNNSSVIISNKPIKAYSSEYMEACKYSKTSQPSNDASNIYRKSSTIAQDPPYKPKTAFQESYLAQRFPTNKKSSQPNITPNAITVPIAQSSTSIQNVSYTTNKVFSTAANNVSSSITHTSNIQHTNSSKTVVSLPKNISDIIIHRPIVNQPQMADAKLSMQSSEVINRHPSIITMQQVSSSTHVESLHRPKISNSSQGHPTSSNISVNFKPGNSTIHSKSHVSNHYPSNHSIQSLSQSSSSHRYDSTNQSKLHKNQSQVDQYHSNRNPNDRQPHKGSSSDPLANLRLMQGLSVSSIPKKTSAYPATSSSSSHSTNLATSSAHKTVIPNKDQKEKHGNPDNIRKMPGQSVFSNLSAEQMESLRSSSQHQQEFWKHINASGYFTGLSPSEAMRYMNQSGQYTGNGSGSSKQGQY